MTWSNVPGPRRGGGRSRSPAKIVTRSGRSVTLRGVGLSGWMNMENFVTGYPATESLQRKALRKALGEDGHQAYFNRFLEEVEAIEEEAL